MFIVQIASFFVDLVVCCCKSRCPAGPWRLLLRLTAVYFLACKINHANSLVRFSVLSDISSSLALLSMYMLGNWFEVFLA